MTDDLPTRYDGALEPSLAGRPLPWDWDAFAVAREHYAGLGLAAPVDAS